MTLLPLSPTLPTRWAFALTLAGLLVSSVAAEDPKPITVSPQTQKINELIAKGWSDAGVKKPSPPATDLEFMRRVFVDLIGRIPTPEEIVDFETDRLPNKRARLVSRLLYETKYTPKDRNGKPVTKIAGLASPVIDYTEAYANHWADIWTVSLMTRSGHPTYRNQMRRWLEIQFSKNLSHKEMVTKLLTAKGKSGEDRIDRGGNPDANAANFIIMHLGEKVPADPADWTPEMKTERNQGQFDAVPITSRVTRLFLGLQTNCTQCHDHPQNKQWLQADFWGVNAFFRQTVRSATPTPAPMARNGMDAPAVAITLSDMPSLNPSGIIRYERRDGKMLATYPIMLKDMVQAEKNEKSTKVLTSSGSEKSRREQLAVWVTEHDSFGKAFVNRTWGHLFGRGLQKEPAFDDLGNTETVHPELLAFLAEEFVRYGTDPKKLLEWVCTSDVYQLSHVAAKEYTEVKFDPYFTRMPLKAMAPEVLFESLEVATQQSKGNDEEARKRRDRWMNNLVRNFGDDEGNELNFNGTIVQALLMMNGKDLNEVLGGGKNQGVVHDVMVKRGNGGPAGVYDELFLMTLNRHPTKDEVAKLEQVRMGMAKVNVGGGDTPPPGKGPKPKGPTSPSAGGVLAPGALPTDPAFYQDVLWALLNTNEFMLNH